MIKQYIKQALRMIGENKLLSVISILGTALAICMIMVIVILYVVNTASFKPEVNRGRTCYITTVMSNGKDDNRRISYSSLGLPLVKEGLALLTIAFIPSAVIFANLLYMEVTQGSEIPPDMASRLLFGFVFSYAVMAAMIVVGISFPSYRAMRMHPADALRQE